MTDTVIKGTGNSRFLRSVPNIKSLYPTYDDFLTALAAGTFPVDLLGLNAAGLSRKGTDLTKASLLTDATASLLGLTSADPTVDEALKGLGELTQNPYLWDGPKKLGSLVAGDKIKLNENGQPKQFIVLDLDHYGPGTGVTLLRKDTFDYTQWNAGDANNAEQFGYFGCSMDNFCDGIWPLKLDVYVQKFIVPVPIVVAQRAKSNLITIFRKGFSLSCAEVNVTKQVTEGTAFSYFDTAQKRVAKLDESTMAMVWALRSPVSGSYGDVYVGNSGIAAINTGGSATGKNALCINVAARPAANLSADLPITSTKDSDGCYNLLAKESA